MATIYYGIQTAKGKPITNNAKRSDLIRDDAPAGFNIASVKTDIPGLSKFEVKCLMLQLAYMISSYDYTKTSGTKYGKYQTDITLLKTYGYVNTAGDWTGKNGIFNSTEFLSTTGLQDLVMQEFLQNTYTTLSYNGALQPGDTADIVGGMLALAYQFHDMASYVTKAAEWRVTGAVVDSMKNPGYLYFNAGRYAITSLAADVVA